MSFNTTHLGFRIHYFRDLSNAGTIDLHTVRFDGSIPLDLQKNCPGCLTVLRTFCTLISLQNDKRIRIGCCESCGYMGYMDRPTKDWIVRYYVEEWDNAKIKDVKKDAATLRYGLSKEQFAAVHMAENFSISKERAVCDIGCGNGAMLKGFQNLGFNNSLGVENSRYRAELAREKYGFDIIAGNFENQDVLNWLAAKSPIGIFLSFHVFEHIYDPREIMAGIAKLQQEGDYLILAMPDVMFEPSVVTFFWLPHLHSYSRVTLERLLNSHGYEITDDNFTYKRLMVAAKKVKSPKPRYHPLADYTADGLSRMREWFFLDKFARDQRYRMSWTSKSYRTAYREVSSSELLDHTRQKAERFYQYFAARLFGKFNNERSFVISPLDKRLTSFSESPMEIQYDGDIELLLR